MVPVFKVRRSEPELVKPAKATPTEVKFVSDWDDRVLLRNLMPCFLFYKNSSTMSIVNDPVVTIKRALAEALVYYYPLAGRLKELGPDKRLVVDCSAEGVVFISADADVRLEELGKIHPPFPWMEDLLYNSKTTPERCPLFTMQVTRLACRGLIIAFNFNHVMCDMVGAAQFLTTVSELCRGALAPSIPPVWQRELLNARDNPPPRMQTTDNEDLPILYSRNPDVVQSCNMTYRSFFFGPREVEVIRARLPQSSGNSFTSFEIVSACVFHCWVVSLEHALEEQMRAVFTVNARSNFIDHPLPSGYYGNVSFPAVITRPMQSFHDLSYVVEQVRKAKEAISEDYARLLIEEQVLARRFGDLKFSPTCPTYIISDVSRVGLSRLDFGWGNPVCAGTSGDHKFDHFRSYMIAFTNNKGEEGRLITLYMPKVAMDKFDLKLRALLKPV